MPTILSPLHQDLTFLSPLSESRAAKLVDFIATHLVGTVIDVGCGWGELLIRTLEAAADARGIGMDIEADFIAHAESLARARGVAPRVAWLAGDVKNRPVPSCQAAICIGASQIWGPPVEANLPLDYASALAALRKMVDRGSPVIYGEAIWTSEPTSAAIAPLAGRNDEFVRLPELLAMARSGGFAVMQVHQASLQEWDEFESGFSARYARWLKDHSTDHADAREVAERAEKQSRAYFSGYRGVLGMAYLAMFAV
jgi:SAM-dependent methyltransferase